MKELGYKIFAFLYRIFCIFPVNNKKVFLVMTHDAGPEGNVAVIKKYIKEHKKGYKFYELKRQDTGFGHSLKKIWHFFITDCFHLATSRYVFLDNMFLPMAYMHFRKKVSVVQLWHGTGVIKKIGADVNTGRLRELEYAANQNTTHLLVASQTTAHIYGRSFSVSPDKVYITGMPRDDVFFDKNYQEQALEQFYQEYPQCRNRKLILYAPTFRDSQRTNPVVELDYNGLAKELGQDYVIGLRLHPFVAGNRRTDVVLEENVIDFSTYASLNTLLFATSCLISDYSSIIFEYAALLRPMLFFAYDLHTFEKEGRGFYWDYEQYVPGPVLTTNAQVLAAVRQAQQQPEEMLEQYHVKEFQEKTFFYKDCDSAKRIMQLLME